MGFLTSAEAVVAQAIAKEMRPPPRPDITRWATENVVFDERSPMPGPFAIGRFPFLREIHEVLAPDHPAREVTVMGSAQWGKTVSVVNATLGCWFAVMPLDALVVHPTLQAALEWVDNKWMPMRRQARDLRELFGDGRGENRDTRLNQETLPRTGSLKVASSGSPADLTGTTRRLIVMDDVAKFEKTDKGDPEELAVSRASGFEDAKILRVSTPLIKGTCRISRAYARSDARVYLVPCPHCGHEAPLTWENFRASIDPERLDRAHFTCDGCGAAIEHAHKERMVAAGRWHATNPRGDHPGFFLWRAYAPQRDWASIAVDYARIMGWTHAAPTGTAESHLAQQVASETEQTFWNDVLGLPYEQATGGLEWQRLRDRVELDDSGVYLPPGTVPARGVLLTAGVDCQGDRLEVVIVAWGRNRRSWLIDHVVIPQFVGDEAAWGPLDALLKAEWRTELALPLRLDALAIDGSAYTDAVWSWAARHPRDRVQVVKGSSSQNGPALQPMKDYRRDGKARRRPRRQGFLVNVSQLKGDFYGRLVLDDPEARGFVAFARGLPEEVYRQITAEVRVLKRQASGVVISQWQLVEPTRRNEVLDAYLYAEAAARRAGWAAMTEAEWDALEALRSAPPADRQPDLFQAPAILPPPAPDPASTPPRRPGRRRIAEIMP